VSTYKFLLVHTQELMYRFGRGYPAGWQANGLAMHCLARVEWLGPDGTVLAQLDAHEKERFLAHVANHRVPRIAAHWAWMLQPLVSDHSERSGSSNISISCCSGSRISRRRRC
jgi:hypothetical protein